MSSVPRPQCLFCNHLNPAGASFCNDCGSQMHLQPCDRCGAINKRTAKNCYKCDSGFTHSAEPEPEPEPEIGPAPAILDKDVAGLARAREHTPVPLEAAHSPPAPPQVYELVSPERAATTRSGRTWRVAASAILFTAMATSVYYYSDQSAPPAKKQAVTQLAPSVSGTLISVDATPPIVAAPVEAASTPTSTAPKPAVDTSELAEPLALAPTAVSAAPTVRPSLSASSRSARAVQSGYKAGEVTT
jgi:ribosomal protein L40E